MEKISFGFQTILKTNTDKCHISLSVDVSLFIKIDNEVIKNSDDKNLLGITKKNRLRSFTKYLRLTLVFM